MNWRSITKISATKFSQIVLPAGIGLAPILEQLQGILQSQLAEVQLACNEM